MTSYELKPIKDATKEYDDCSYEYVSCCYADGNGEKHSVYSCRLKTMDRNDGLKYFDIIKESLKGTLNKNAFVTKFSDEQKAEGGLKDRLKTALLEPLNEANMTALFDMILPALVFESGTNNLITVANNIIDIKPRTKDRITIDDASEYSFPYLVISVCPAKLSDPGLAFDEESGEFRTRITDWVAGNPFLSIVYPVPAGCGADMDHAIVFSRSREYEDAAAFMEKLLGEEEPPRPSNQVFDDLKEIVTATFDVKAEPERVERIDEELKQFKKEYNTELAMDYASASSLPPEPAITKNELKDIIRNTGASEEELQAFEECYEERVGDKKLPLYGVKSLAKELAKPSVLIKTDNPDALEKRIIDGQEYLLVPLSEGVRVNDQEL